MKKLIFPNASNEKMFFYRGKILYFFETTNCRDVDLSRLPLLVILSATEGSHPNKRCFDFAQHDSGRRDISTSLRCVRRL